MPRKKSPDRTPPTVHLKVPSFNEVIPPGNGTWRVRAELVGAADWLDKLGLPAWPKPKKPASREGVVEGSDDTSVPTDDVVITIDSVPMRSWLGPRTAPDRAEVWTDVSVWGLAPGSHDLQVALVGSDVVINRPFSVGVPGGVMFQQAGDGPPPVPRQQNDEAPGPLTPEQATLERLAELLRRFRDPFQPVDPDDLERRARRLRRRLQRIRELYPEEDWILIPPYPPYLIGWRIVPRRLRRLFERLREAVEAWEEAYRRYEADRGNADRFLEQWRRLREVSDAEDAFSSEARCYCGCGVCIRFVRLKHSSFHGTRPDDAHLRRDVTAANQYFRKCAIWIDVEGIHEIDLTDDEARRYFRDANVALNSGNLLRELAARVPNAFSSDCFTVFLADPPTNGFGPHPTLPGRAHAFVSGTEGTTAVPRRAGDPVPRHMIIEDWVLFSPETLAHETGHLLCLPDRYVDLYDVFPQPAGLDETQRRHRAYDAAVAWKRRQDAAVDQLRQQDTHLSEAEARKRVRDGLTRADQRIWDRVYDLMALGDEISCDDCQRMCRCFAAHYPAMCGR